MSALHEWIDVAAPRIVKRGVLGQAVLAFAAGPKEPDDDAGDAPVASTCEAVDRDSAADLVALVRELRERVRVIVRKLGRKGQWVLDLWFEGWEPREIAVELGIPAANVRVILHRTLSAIRQALRECDNGGMAERRGEEWLNLATELAHPSGILDKSANACYKYPQCTFKYLSPRPHLARRKRPVPGGTYRLRFESPEHKLGLGLDARDPISSRSREDIMVQPLRSVDKSIYLGGEYDPKPIFRDQQPQAFDWPEGAVFAVVFRAEDFPGLGKAARSELPQTEFFGEDGWPLDLPSALKASLPEVHKLEFQVHPWGWRHWDHWTWESAHEFPHLSERIRAQASIVAPLAAFASANAPVVSSS